MNQEKTVFICEDSTEGIFTAVYDGWMEAKKVQIQIRTCEPEDLPSARICGMQQPLRIRIVELRFFILFISLFSMESGIPASWKM